MTGPLVHTCTRCGHSWVARVKRPIRCPAPRCGSPYWWIAPGILPMGKPKRGRRLTPAPDHERVLLPKRRSLFCPTCDDRTLHELLPEGTRCMDCMTLSDPQPDRSPEPASPDPGEPPA